MNAPRGTLIFPPTMLVAVAVVCASVPWIPAHLAGEAPAWSSADPVAEAADVGKLEACKLISAADAGKILGTPVTVKPIDTSAAGPDAASMCSYQTGHVGGGFSLLAGRAHYSDATAEVARRKKEAVSGIPPGIPTPTFTDVPGLGQAAYLAKTSSSLELNVLQGGAVLVVTFVGKPDEATIEKSEKLARVALAGLATG